VRVLLRGSSRSAALLRGGSVGVAARVITIGSGFILTPITLARAGLSDYGLFAALTAFSGLLAFTDLGLSNGLMAQLSRARAAEDRHAATSSITNALAMLVLMGLCLAALGAACSQLAPWADLLNAAPEREPELSRAVLVMSVSLAVGLPGGLAIKILFALLRPATANVWGAGGALVSSLFVAVAAGLARPLPWMVAAQVAVPGLTGLVALLWLWRREPFVGFDLRLLRLTAGANLVKAGRVFVFLQFAAVLSYQIDVIVVARLLGPTEAGVFATTMKLIAVPLALSTVFLTPLWPAFADASNRADMVWIRTTYGRAIRIGLLFGVSVAAALVLTGGWLVEQWTQGQVSPPRELIWVGAIWVVAYMVNQPQAMLLNGLHVEGFQVRTVSVTLAANLVLSVLLTRAVGVSGPLLGTVISQVLFTLLPTTFWLRRRLAATTGKPLMDV
jgi:O-antigen/teichoic acid export membrane protein